MFILKQHFNLNIEQMFPCLCIHLSDRFRTTNYKNAVAKGEGSICDLSTQPKHQPISLNCKAAFICGILEFETNLDLSLVTEKLYVEKDSEIKTTKPQRGTDGDNGLYPGDNGSDGEDGKAGVNMVLTVDQLLQYSDTRLTFISDAGDAGDGGNGNDGKPPAVIPWSPKTAKDVCDHGEIYNYYHDEGSDHLPCDMGFCPPTTTWERTNYDCKFVIETSTTCGGNGGSGGMEFLLCSSSFSIRMSIDAI